MTFGKLRKNLGQAAKDGSYELLRFCNKRDTVVIGAASKLFQHFLRENSPELIITYADRRWTQSSNNVYLQIGLNYVSTSQPSYFYVIDEKRENRFKHRKNVLIEQGYDGNKTEHQIMLDRDIYRIYDCGCLKYERRCCDE